jgi:TP53 regulating kinase-like protein
MTFWGLRLMSEAFFKGAEAELILKKDSVIKKRVKKGYRISEIDIRLRKSRTKREAKVLEKCILLGLNVPKLVYSDEEEFELGIERIKGKPLKDVLGKGNFSDFSGQIAYFLTKIHDAGIIHHDLTTSNMIAVRKRLFFIDFGLSFFSHKPEDKAVDLHLLERALESKHPSLAKEMFKEIIAGYKPKGKKEIIARLRIVQARGRNKAKQK